MTSNTIIIIDTDYSFIDRFNKNLAVFDLDGEYHISTVKPDTTVTFNEMVESCVSDVGKIISDSGNVIGIFVDIVIIETGDLDTSGIQIAAILRKSFPELPIFNITKQANSIAECNMISDATLEDVDGVLIKSYLDQKGFSTDRLKTLFKKATEKRFKYGKNIAPETAALPALPVPDRVKTAYNYDSLEPRVAQQIDDIGKAEFWTLLEKLIPDGQGVVSYMQPGKSGAYIFRVSVKIRANGEPATSPKNWVVKASDKPELIERELKNYRELRNTQLHRAFYPSPKNDGVMTAGNVAGLAIELENDSLSLFDRFTSLSGDDLDAISSGIDEVLQKTYGDPIKNIFLVWNNFYKLDKSVSLKITRVMEEYKEVFDVAKSDGYKNVFDFVNTNGATKPSVINFSAEVEERTIHGDFNSRNLLVNNKNQLVLIDFFSRGRNHVVRDIAKLERDVVFRVFDGRSRLYYDWSRIKVWEHFSSLNRRGEIFSPEPPLGINNAELKKTLRFISGIRAILKTRVPNVDEKEYLCGILHYSLLALAHSEISIHKKVFAVDYINNVLNLFD